MQGSTREWQLGDGREDAQQVKPAAFGGSAHVHEHQRTTIHAILHVPEFGISTTSNEG